MSPVDKPTDAVDAILTINGELVNDRSSPFLSANANPDDRVNAVFAAPTYP